MELLEVHGGRAPSFRTLRPHSKISIGVKTQTMAAGVQLLLKRADASGFLGAEDAQGLRRGCWDLRDLGVDPQSPG